MMDSIKLAHTGLFPGVDSSYMAGLDREVSYNEV